MLSFSVIDSVDDSENMVVLEKIIKSVGRPLNYGLTPDEMEEERKKKEEMCQQQLKQEKVEKELKEIEDNAKMTALLEQWVRLSKCHTNKYKKCKTYMPFVL